MLLKRTISLLLSTILVLGSALPVAAEDITADSDDRVISEIVDESMDETPDEIPDETPPEIPDEIDAEPLDEAPEDSDAVSPAGDEEEDNAGEGETNEGNDTINDDVVNDEALLQQFYDLDLDLYRAELLVDRNETSITNILNWWTPAEILASDIELDEGFTTQLNAWSGFTFTLGDVPNRVLTKRQTYELFLLDMLEAQEISDETADFITADYNQKVLSYFSAACKYLKIAVKDENGSILKALEKVSTGPLEALTDNEKKGLCSMLDGLDKTASVANTFLKSSKTIYDVVKKMAMYSSLNTYFDTSMSDTLEQLKAFAGNDQDLIEAIDRIAIATSDSISNEIITAVEGFETISTAIISELGDKLVEKMLEGTGLGILLKGQKIGKVIADAVFNTSDIYGQVYVIRAYPKLIEATRGLVRSSMETFRASRTSESASMLVHALTLYMNCAEKGCDYAKNLADSVQKASRGIFFAKNQKSCEEFKTKCDNIRQIYSSEKNFLMNDLWRLAFVLDHEGIWELICDVPEYQDWTLTQTAVTDIELGYSAITVKPGDPAFQIQATCAPKTATDKTLQFSSSNSKCATVSGDGWVTPKAIGTTTITITSPATAFQQERRTSVTVTVSSGAKSIVIDHQKYTVTREYADTDTEHETDGTVSVKQDACKYADVVIPRTIPFGDKTYTVDEVAIRGYSANKYLVSIVLPETIEKIGSYAFNECSKLARINIPEAVTRIEDFTFYNDSALTKVDLPDTIRYIGASSFRQTRITSINIPEGVTSIEESSFDHSYLTEVTIPKTVTTIARWAFCDCRELKKVIIEGGPTIGTGVFSGDTVLTEMDLGKTTRLESDALESTAITSLTIPKETTYINYSAIDECASLQKIVVDTDNTKYTSKDGVLYDKSMKQIIRYPAAKTATTFTIPASVQVIGTYSFRETRNLKTLNIPETVKCIEQCAFRDCADLETVTLPGGIVYYGGYHFSGCIKLSKVTLKKGMTEIPNYMFEFCESLKSITLPDTLQSIGTNSFYGGGLTSVKIPASVNYIANHAFWYCNSMKTATFAGSPPTFANSFPTASVFAYPSGIPEWKEAAANRRYTIPGDKYDISKCTVKLKSSKLVYTGSAQTPAVTVTYNGVAVPMYDYQITYAKNKSIGKATVTVTGIYNGSGSKTVSFTIVPKATSVSSFTPVSGGFTVKWAKRTPATGYEIQYSTSSTFKAGSATKTVKVTSYKTVSKKFTKLKKKKRYYVRIRVYKTVNGTMYCSAWSAKKYVTTKA